MRLVLVAVVVAARSSNHELHRVLLIAADVAVAHEEQLQGVLPNLSMRKKKKKGCNGRGPGGRTASEAIADKQQAGA